MKQQFICNDCLASSGQAELQGLQQASSYDDSFPPVANGWAETKSDPRLGMLMMQVSQLEEQRQADDQSLRTLSKSIDSMNKELGGLSAEVKFWKNEVKRVEEETIAQQSADLASFNTLGELVQQLPRASNSDSR